jgi:hypothetical protein
MQELRIWSTTQLGFLRVDVIGEKRTEVVNVSE